MIICDVDAPDRTLTVVVATASWPRSAAGKTMTAANVHSRRLMGIPLDKATGPGRILGEGDTNAKDDRNQVAQGCRGTRLSGGQVIPRTALSRDGREGDRRSSERGPHRRVQGEGCLQSVGRVAARRQQLTRREGSQEDQGGALAFTHSTRATGEHGKGRHRRRLSSDVRRLFIRRGRAHPLQDRWRARYLIPLTNRMKVSRSATTRATVPN